MPTTRWWWGDPLTMFAEMRRSEASRQQSRECAGVYPAVNLYDDGESILIRAEIPGLDKTKLDITAKGNQVSIRGQRSSTLPEGAAYHRRERGCGVFHRVVALPDAVDSSKTVAVYKNGILEIVCPRLEQAKPRRVTVE